MSKTHDYTKGRWGHALHGIEFAHKEHKPSFWDRLRGIKDSMWETTMTCTGHGDVAKGDILLIAMQSGRIAKVQIVDLKYFSNPRDMFQVTQGDLIGYVGDN